MKAYPKPAESATLGNFFKDRNQYIEDQVRTNEKVNLLRDFNFQGFIMKNILPHISHAQDTPNNMH